MIVKKNFTGSDNFIENQEKTGRMHREKPEFGITPSIG